MRSSWPSVFSLSNSFQFVLPGPGLAGAVFARVAASWCDALTCILYLHVLAAFCLWSAISSGTVDRDQVPLQLLILIILISTFTSSILCYTLTLDMGTSHAIADMLYEWGSLCGYGAWHQAPDQELITLQLLLFLWFHFVFWPPVSKF